MTELNVQNNNNNREFIQHVFIIGAKSVGQYGGFETFVHQLISEHENESGIKYHVASKANGEGYMDESKLDNIHVINKNDAGEVTDFEYKAAHIFKIPCPSIGAAVAVYYDKTSLLYCINYCIDHNISNPIFYILTNRIGLFIKGLEKRIRTIGGKLYLNPDGYEWKRSKWSLPVREYWKWSEKKMVSVSNLVICDSKCIETYISDKYRNINTTYIPYGADINQSSLSDDNPKYLEFIEKNRLTPDCYYMSCGRLVPENSFETMIREFMYSDSPRDYIIISTKNDELLLYLEKKLHWSADPRIKFVGEIYDTELLKKVRENAYGNIHGHTVGGTNPSLLEALASTDLNLLIDVEFNREVAEDAALFWNQEKGVLAKLINKTDGMDYLERQKYGDRAKKRITTAYNWKRIGEEYKKLWSFRGPHI